MAKGIRMDKRRQLAFSAYIHGCYRELLALKPGNVGMHAAGHDMTVDQFQRSARVSAYPLCDPVAALGKRILSSVEATREAVGCNTNLGIILLCSPLLQAYLDPNLVEDLRTAVGQIIEASTVEDAVLCYEAIRLACPGGLGESAEQDIQQIPDVSLLETMQLAAAYDRIAFQYAHGYADIFDDAIPRLVELRGTFPAQDNWAVTALYLYLLARYPDTHIVRKQGMGLAQQVSQQAADLETALLRKGPTMAVQKQLQQADRKYKDSNINPGTTADMVVATLVALQLSQAFTVKQMEAFPDYLQEVEQSFFTTNTLSKEVHYGSNQ